MKIAITGATSGLGKIFFDHLSKSHDVENFSRSNGFDFSKLEALDNLVQAIGDFDLLINNAHVGTSQTQLTMKLAQFWRTKPRSAIWNITSTSAWTSSRYSPTYTAEKTMLDKVSYMYQSNDCVYPKITLLRFHVIDTPVWEGKNVPKLFQMDIIRTVDFLMSLPPDLHIMELSLKLVNQQIQHG
jgi:hypothetical protein